MTLTHVLAVVALSAAFSAAVATAEPVSLEDVESAASRVEVRFISLAPSPYTSRHDSMRAGYGIFQYLGEIIETHRLPITLSYFDAAESLEQPQLLLDLVDAPEVLIFGGSVWAQGSARFPRQFFEIVGGGNWLGKSVSVWGTAGGSHTGGSQLASDFLRSAMGMGARVFSLSQKYMIFTTDERVGITDHHFSNLDLWFMQQFACTIAVNALTHVSPRDAAADAEILDCDPHYYTRIPKQDGGLDGFTEFASFLNAAADDQSQEWASLRRYIQRPGVTEAMSGLSAEQRAQLGEKEKP